MLRTVNPDLAGNKFRFQHDTYRLYGSYEALKYNTIVDGLTDLTGGVAETMDMKEDPTACSILLRGMLDMSSLITCSTPNVRKELHRKLFSRGFIVAKMMCKQQISRRMTSDLSFLNPCLLSRLLLW